MSTPQGGRQLWSIGALSAGYFAHIGFFNPYLPLWLQDLGYGLLAISVMTSLPSATRLFAPYVWGWLSDHTGRRVGLLRWCAVAALLCSVALWQSWGVTGLFVVLLLMFFHTSGMMPLSEALLAHAVSHEGCLDARRYGRVRLWGSLGFLLTVVVAGWWFERHGLATFPWWTSLTLLAVVLSAWAMPNHREPPQAAHEQVRVWPVLRQPVVLGLFLSAFFHVLAHVCIYVFFSLYLDGLGYSKAVIGLLWAAGVAAEVVWFFTQGRWLPKLGLTQWLLLASGLAVLRLTGLAAGAHWLWLLFAVQMIHAVSFAAHHSVCVSLLMLHFPGRLHARGQALYSVICYGVSGVLGGVLGGMISTVWGLAAVFWAGALCATVASAVSGWLWWRQRTCAPNPPGPTRSPAPQNQ